MTFLFLVSWGVLLIYAIRLMSRGWNAVGNDPVKTLQPQGEWKTQVKKPVHPEMVDVKPGEELMGVTFMKEVSNQKIEDPRFKLDSPELHNLEDSLHKSLQERINELRDEEDDDDDGGALVPAVKR